MASASSTAIASVFRFASSASSATARQCPRCLRTFSSYRPLRQSAKRQLMTDSAYRPRTLDPGPPPPRNADVPDTSIAGGVPQMDSRYSWTPTQVDKLPKAPQNASFSLPEEEAQKSRPVDPQAQPAKAASKPRSRLRPRKAAMVLTPSAVEQLREILDDPEPKLIRVGVKNKGCSGSSYHLEYVDKPGKFDEQVEQDGVKVLIDSKALIKVIGSEMDWVEDKLSARFTFRNPNVTEECGCGESFSIS